MLGKIPGFRQIAQMRKMAGVDVGQIMNAAGMEKAERKFSPPKPTGDKNKDKRKAQNLLGGK